MKDILLQHISELITGVIAILLGWFGKGRIAKKQDEADLTSRIQNVYSDFVAHTKEQIEGLTNEIESLQQKQLDSEVSWKKKIASVEKRWQTKYNTLKTQFEQYKEKHP